MKKTAAIGALVIAPSLMFAAATAQAATVQYLNVNDAVTSYFDAATTAPDAGNPDKLIIGLVAFEASAPGETGVLDVAFDTISFTIQAEPNYVIKKITYLESGAYNNGDGAITYATGSWVVNGKSQSLGIFIQPDNGSGDWSLSKSTTFSTDVTSVLVSITNTLNAVAPGATTAQISKTAASVVVETAFIPLPPSVWLLGSALFGVGVLGRRLRGVKAA